MAFKLALTANENDRRPLVFSLRAAAREKTNGLRFYAHAQNPSKTCGILQFRDPEAGVMHKNPLKSCGI